ACPTPPGKRGPPPAGASPGPTSPSTTHTHQTSGPPPSATSPSRMTRSPQPHVKPVLLARPRLSRHSRSHTYGERLAEHSACTASRRGVLTVRPRGDTQQRSGLPHALSVLTSYLETETVTCSRWTYASTTSSFSARSAAASGSGQRSLTWRPIGLRRRRNVNSRSSVITTASRPSPHTDRLSSWPPPPRPAFAAVQHVWP